MVKHWTDIEKQEQHLIALRRYKHRIENLQKLRQKRKLQRDQYKKLQSKETEETQIRREFKNNSKKQL